MSMNFDYSDLLRLLDDKKQDIIDHVEIRMHDSTDDLARIANDIAPIDKSTLRRSVNKTVEASEHSVIGEVTFSVTENIGSRFNYAQWIHEMDYNLGEQSRSAPGIDGYNVGKKYLERPLKGEEDKYLKWLAEGVVDGLNS